MEDIKFTVSEELKTILKKANDTARKNGDRDLTVELLAYVLLDHYINSSGPFESEVISDLLEEYSEEQKKEILKVAEEEYKGSAKKTTLFSHFENYAFSEALEKQFNHIEAFLELKREFVEKKPGNGKVMIGSEDFFSYGILNNKSLSLTERLDSGFGFNYAKFMAQDICNKLFGPGTGELKEKRVEPTPADEAKAAKEDDDKFEKAGEGSEAMSVKKRDPNSKTPVLDQYGLDMTKKAADGGYDPVIGRDKEISQVIEILCCRKKNNAALLGDAGVGKTALVEGLAAMISAGNVPMELKGKRIFSVSTTDLQAGTIYRGQLEERIQELCEEVRENKDIIVYIDEFHQAVSEGSSNIAQMLKPALSRGEMNMIISTTTSEFRRYIEKDAALKRRFEPVYLEEPGVEETVEILKGISPSYSKFHHVKVSEDVIRRCVEWSGQYITDRQFPDKAIGILDMSCSLTKLANPLDYDKRKELQDAIDELNKQADQAIENSEFEHASKIRDTRVSVEEELKNLIAEQETNEEKWPEVTVECVSQVISKFSGVPIDKILSSDMTKVREMKAALSEKVIGQDKAIEELTIALQRNILGLRDPKKPIASFLLVGPTGVGKSLVSKVLASEFFGSEKSLVTIACSEYMQDWAESKLLGSAPGYVGFENTEPRLYVLKRKPYCVLLIDEIEKSSSNLYNIWLNMLEEGEITLSSGEKVSCRDCIIIFTGNVGTKSLELKTPGLGFGTIKEDDKRKSDLATVMKEVEKEFRPEFRNRLSKIIVFNSLGDEELLKIFDLELKKLQDRLKEKYELNVTKKLKTWIVGKAEPKYGARSLQRLIVEYIEQELCKALLEHDPGDKHKVTFDLAKDETIKTKFS